MRGRRWSPLLSDVRWNDEELLRSMEGRRAKWDGPGGFLNNRTEEDLRSNPLTVQKETQDLQVSLKQKNTCSISRRLLSPMVGSLRSSISSGQGWRKPVHPVVLRCSRWASSEEIMDSTQVFLILWHITRISNITQDQKFKIHSSYHDHNTYISYSLPCFSCVSKICTQNQNTCISYSLPCFSCDEWIQNPFQLPYPWSEHTVFSRFSSM